MLEKGIYFAPSQFEAMFRSTAHSTEDLDKTIEANYLSLKSLLMKRVRFISCYAQMIDNNLQLKQILL